MAVYRVHKSCCKAFLIFYTITVKLAGHYLHHNMRSLTISSAETTIRIRNGRKVIIP